MVENLAIWALKSYYLIMDEVYFLVEECAEGGYTARALGFPIFTQAETLPEIREYIRDAVDCHFETDKPKVLRLHIVRDEILAYA
jgi:predicted RNase H-like HicB family nuclease